MTEVFVVGLILWIITEAGEEPGPVSVDGELGAVVPFEAAEL